jgi:His/Glu/Gln/Arg/opine family amino acid ABC transporter permease subunit
MGDDLGFIADYLPELLIGFPGHRPGGLLMSVLLAIGGLAIGLVLALGLALLHESRQASLRLLARTVVYLGRGVPLILMLLLVHQFLGTGRLGVTTSSLQSALVTLAIYSAAYQAEILHTGLRAVPAMLVDDARLLGASRTAVFWRIRLPYALRVMQPALTGQAITVFKDSSVVVVLGVADLTTTARIVLGAEVANAPRWLAVYLTVGVLYLGVALALSRLAARTERRVSRSALLAPVA